MAIDMVFSSMDPFSEDLGTCSAHVAAWKWWYAREGRHFDNGLRHPDFQLDNPPSNAQVFQVKGRAPGSSDQRSTDPANGSTGEANP